MTNRLVIQLPCSKVTIESDDVEALEILSDICKKDFGAYHHTKDANQLLISDLNGNLSNKLHSLIYELGLF